MLGESLMLLEGTAFDSFKGVHDWRMKIEVKEVLFHVF
mgnify:CR=1 FL=1